MIMIFKQKFTSIVCSRFIFGFDMVKKLKIPRIPKPSYQENLNLKRFHHRKISLYRIFDFGVLDMN